MAPISSCSLLPATVTDHLMMLPTEPTAGLKHSWVVDESSRPVAVTRKFQVHPWSVCPLTVPFGPSENSTQPAWGIFNGRGSWRSHWPPPSGQASTATLFKVVRLG